jgi:nucleotide-binding universal stress UspA family protein
MTKNLLFPTDFTDHSIKALEEALILNRKLKYHITVFHAFSRPFTENKSGFKESLGLKQLEERIDKQFAKLEKALPELAKHQHTLVRKLGYSVDLIPEYVKEHDISLIVMNTKGAVGVGELWGTKTARIIKMVEIPAVVIPTGTRLSELSELGLACDFSDDTEYDKVAFLIEIAEKCAIPIDIITLNRHEKTMTKDELKNRDKLLQLVKNIPAKISYRESNSIKKGLIDYCRSNEIGLLGILPKSYNFIERVFHESLTTRMAFNSPIPILVLK